MASFVSKDQIRRNLFNTVIIMFHAIAIIIYQIMNDSFFHIFFHSTSCIFTHLKILILGKDLPKWQMLRRESSHLNGYWGRLEWNNVNLLSIVIIIAWFTMFAMKKIAPHTSLDCLTHTWDIWNQALKKELLLTVYMVIIKL